MAPTGKRPSGRTPGPTADTKDKLKAALTSVGVDNNTISKLLSSRRLGKIVIPLFARGAANDEFNELWLVRLPEFARWFEKGFPDGILRWDREFEDSTTGRARPVIRVEFNHQEGDQGERWSYRPTPLEDEAYHKKLRELRSKIDDKADIHSIL